jgi:hypothetical protein
VPIKRSVVRSGEGNFVNSEDLDGNAIYLWEKVAWATAERELATSTGG